MTSILSTIEWNEFLKGLFPPPGGPYTQEQLARFAEEREARRIRERGPRCDVPVHDDNTGSRCRNVGAALVEDMAHHDCCGDCNDWAETLPRRPMRTPEQQEAFEKYSGYGTRPYHVHDCDETRLILVGGGDFYSEGEERIPDDEYTPDPGDVSVFTWRPLDSMPF